MMAPSHRRYDHESVLTALGCSPGQCGAALPGTSACPLCRHNGPGLRLYEDIIHGGTWCRCADCGFCGDLLSLAATVWNINVEEARSALRRRGAAVGPCSRDRNARHEEDARLRAFWDRCVADVEAVDRHGGLSVLWRALGLGHGCVGGDLRIGVGATTRRAAVDKVKGARFPGRGWTSLAVTRFDDLPGRPCGLEFAGMHGNNLVRRSSWYRGSEGGLSGAASADEPWPRFGNHVFAVDDPFFAARMQSRHAGVSLRSLPLVAYRDNTVAGWSLLHRRTVVFWCWRLTSSVLCHAVKTGGLISNAALITPDEKAASRLVRWHPALDLLRNALQRAVPWREALIVWASRQQAVVIESLLDGVEALCPEMLGRLVGTSAAVDAALAVRDGRPRRVRVGNVYVAERDGCWFEESFDGRRSELLLNAVLRVDDFFIAQDGVATYRLKVRCLQSEQKTFLITVSASAGDRRVIRLLQKEAGRLGLALYVRDRSPGLVRVALQFYRPAALTAVSPGGDSAMCGHCRTQVDDGRS